MRTPSIVLLIALIGHFGMPYARACGDKTMRVQRGLRFYQPLAQKNPSKVLIHSAALPAGKAAELRDFLNKTGHKATSMDDLASVKSSLTTSRYDLVLTDLSDASELQRQVESFTPQTVVVPVLLKQPKAEAKAAKKQYRVIVNNPVDGLDFLIAVARVMDLQSHKS